MRIHFIAIGGAVMHNLAIALHKKGYKVTGSDDEIFGTSLKNLERHNLEPKSIGWNEENITPDIDAVILGMHARIDNPELVKAQNLGLKIYSFPEYLYEQTKNKKRVVIGGSHGKTSITSIIMHVLKYADIKFDYMVGSQIDNFDTMVGLSNESEIAIFEGDEYLSSPIDRRPKFHLYKPHVALLSGIAWDHINVFPTFENYVEQFSILQNMIEENGSLIYFNEDKEINNIVKSIKSNIETIPYSNHKYRSSLTETILETETGDVNIKLFGKHNMQNIAGAKLVCNKIGISDKVFYQAIEVFNGSARRLQVIKQTEDQIVFSDFAHSPSKLKATVNAVKEKFDSKKVMAIMELHTFSSLSKEFLSHYKGCMNNADIPVVYFNEETIKHKKLANISIDDVRNAFETEKLIVFTDSNKLKSFVTKTNADVYLFMSSGNFGGIDLNTIIPEVK